MYVLDERKPYVTLDHAGSDAEFFELRRRTSKCFNPFYEKIYEGVNLRCQMSVVREDGMDGCTERYHGEILKQRVEGYVFEFIASHPGGNHDDP